MYIYNLGYYSHEESEYIQLYHKEKFTSKEFEEIVMNVAVKIIDKEKRNNITFETIFHDVMESLVKDHGFAEVKFDAEFSIFGWANLLKKDDWESEQDELLVKLRNLIQNKPDSAKNS